MFNNTAFSCNVFIQYVNMFIAQLVVSREPDLRCVPYNRPAGVRSFVKNAKNRIQCRPLCNLKTVQDILMEQHRNINQH